jgi:ubiquinone/menaquinone biosynthesis C-methylase UbiE
MKAFEKEAAKYDHQFSDSIIGQLQRQLVWNILHRYLPDRPVNIVETNAGTGVDALHLIASGHTVICTDGAKAMVDILKSKGLNSVKWDLIEAPPAPVAANQYDVVFSNFSGWNCLPVDDIKQLGAELHPLCKPGAVLFVVLFGKYCKWEWLYFLSKGRWKSAFRRFGKSDQVSMNHENITVWYHTAADIQHALNPYFQLVAKHPVNVFVPPSYLKFLQRFPAWMNFFYKLDTALGRTQLFHNWSDHTALIFKRI